MPAEVITNWVILFKAPTEIEGDSYQLELQKSELTVDMVPVLAFNFLNIDVLARKLSGDTAANYGAIILTSVRSVSSVSAALDLLALQGKKTTCQDLKCFVVGKGTSTAATIAGFKPCGQDTGHGRKLAEFIVKEMDGRSDPVLFPCSKIRGDELPTHLKQNGIPLEEVVVYETLPNPQIKPCIEELYNKLNGQPEYLVFFSPSGVNYTLPFLSPLWDLTLSKVVALGPSTEKKLKENSISVFGVPESPTVTDLTRLIIKQKR